MNDTQHTKQPKAPGKVPSGPDGFRGGKKPERTPGKPFRSSRPAQAKPGEKPAYEKFHYQPSASGRGNAGHRPTGQSRNHTEGIVSPARRFAFRILADVAKNDAYASLSLNAHFSGEYISPEDKRLAAALVYGVLEEQLRLDYVLSRFMEHPAVDDYAQIILRIGAYQILFMDHIPESAAVNEAVNQAKHACPSSAAMINGVLRNLCREKGQLSYPDEAENPVSALSILSSTPEWMAKRLCDAYGYEQARNILLFREREHPIVIRPNMTEFSDEDFEKLLQKKQWVWKKGIAPHAYLVTGASSITLDRNYAAGHFSIQGQSSQLAAEALQVKPGMKVLDACAAPGGKSAYLCESMQLTGRVYAWELHEARTVLLEGVKSRLHLDNLRIMVRDASIFREDDEASFDAVLLDAPCSGLGVLSQKPDIKHRLKEEAIPELCETQRRLLETVCRYVKPGGKLVYSTCSILPEENSRQIHAFLAEHPEYELAPLPPSFPEELRQAQTPDGLQILPDRDGLEGFFIAGMRRKSL